MQGYEASLLFFLRVAYATLLWVGGGGAARRRCQRARRCKVYWGLNDTYFLAGVVGAFSGAIVVRIAYHVCVEM
jgi:hypothetical protein